MNNRTFHIIENEFTRNIGHLDEWWEYRLGIYEHYCLASLINQTNKNFTILMTLRYVPLKYQERIYQILSRSGLNYIVRLYDEQTLSETMKSYVEKYNFVYSTRIDSDDMFHKEVVNEIQSYEYKSRRALVYQKGYCYDCQNNRLQNYRESSPPFSTIMFPIDIYIDEIKQDQYKIFRSHDFLVKTMPYIVLSENKYIINIHDTNIASIYQNDRTIFKGHRDETEISTTEIDNILKDFGIDSKTYNLKVKK